VAKLLDEYAAVAPWDVSTRQTNEGFIRRTIKPVLGHLEVRKVRGPILDQLYSRLKRCGDLSCTGNELALVWMPLGSARLTLLGIEPSAGTVDELERLAALVDRELAAARQAQAAATPVREKQDDAAGRPPAIWRTNVAGIRS
jgi:hypothetical protein